MTTNRVIPRYVPANTIEDKFGFLVTATTPEGGRVYLTRSGGWGPVGSADFFDEPLNAADSIKEVKERAEGGYSEVTPDSIQLVRVVGMLIPTVISEDDLRRRRRAHALAKLTPEELEALGLDANGSEAPRRAVRR